MAASQSTPPSLQLVLKNVPNLLPTDGFRHRPEMIQSKGSGSEDVTYHDTDIPNVDLMVPFHLEQHLQSFIDFRLNVSLMERPNPSWPKSHSTGSTQIPSFGLRSSREVYTARLASIIFRGDGSSCSAFSKSASMDSSLIVSMIFVAFMSA
jgi:hypothetical protein